MSDQTVLQYIVTDIRLSNGCPLLCGKFHHLRFNHRHIPKAMETEHRNTVVTMQQYYSAGLLISKSVSMAQMYI